MNISSEIKHMLRRAAFVLLAVAPATAVADSGFYIGGSFGNATVDTGVELPGFSSDFDEDDSAFKAMLGYRLDLPSVFVAVEGGYVDLGQPELTVDTDTYAVDTSGTNLFGIVGLEAGPAEFYLKAGYLSWDADWTFSSDLVDIAGSDNGSDMGYGLGVAFGVGPISVRGEFEKYDIDDLDVSMISVGFTYLFD